MIQRVRVLFETVVYIQSVGRENRATIVAKRRSTPPRADVHLAALTSSSFLPPCEMPGIRDALFMLLLDGEVFSAFVRSFGATFFSV